LCHHLKGRLKHLVHVDEITTSELERLKSVELKHGYSNQTIKHYIGTVRGMIKHAKRTGYQVNDIEYPKIKVANGQLRYLSLEDESRLLAAIEPKREIKGLPSYDKRYSLTRREMQDKYDFLVMLLDTGARYGEISGLEWSKINMADRSIALWRPKVRNESILYMTDRLFNILERRKQFATSKFVFTNRTGGARGYRPTAIKKAFEQAGLHGCTAHTLRHTHATRLIQNGMSIYEVKEILGHADIKTTMRYAHLEQRTISRKATEVIDRLNREQEAMAATKVVLSTV
jgi:integrase